MLVPVRWLGRCRESPFIAETLETPGPPNAFATKSVLPDATLAAVKRVLRFAILIPGLLYLWALLPIWFRPQYTGSPLRKQDATVNVDVVGAAASGATPSVKAAAAVGFAKISNSRIKSACEPPTLLKPVVRPAKYVVVRYLENGKVVAQTRYDCSKYV
jgi:hypothetical protein